MTSLYTGFKLLAVTEQEETGKIVRKERINSELNESIHQNLFMKPVAKPVNAENFHSEMLVTE